MGKNNSNNNNKNANPPKPQAVTQSTANVPKQQPTPESTPPSDVRDGDSPPTMLATPISPTSDPANATEMKAQSATGVSAPNMHVIHELLHAFKATLGTLGSTIDILGEQPERLSEVSQAIDAEHQIRVVREQVEQQHGAQEEEMQKVKKFVSDEVKAQVRDALRAQVNRIVSGIVQKEITKRIQAQLAVQIPSKLREDAREFKQKLLEAKINLHNSEARRMNALVPSTALDEPLGKLLRPSSASSRGMQGAAQGSDFVGAVGGSVIDLPTPSPLFPANASALINLKHDDLRRLLHEYQLTEARPIAQGKPSPGLLRQDLKEQDINTFLSFIGITFSILASAPVAGKHSNPPSPLLTRVSNPYM